MPNWIGDVVMATPILEDLRKLYPKAEITAMCFYPTATLLEKDPNIDEIFSFTTYGIFTRHTERRNIVKKLQRGRYDIGILLTNSFSSAWIFWQGRIKKRIGYRGNFRTFLLTDPLSYSIHHLQQHQVITYKLLLSPLSAPLSTEGPKLYLAPEEIENAQNALQSYSIPKTATLLGIHAGASYGSAKCWLPERFTSVATALLQQDPSLFILFFGDATTLPLVKSICQTLPSRAINIAGATSIRELMALISLCHAFLSNDSGPMHIADAFGIPTIALFGSTSAEMTRPYNGGVVIQKNVPCSPCFQRICPTDFRCMKQIEVEEVYLAVLKALQKKLPSHETMAQKNPT